jgi:mannose-6-phosphate isomerase-like protein (cupin superfamily)
VADPQPTFQPLAPRIVEKPWGRETIFAETNRYTGKILFVARGSRLSLQYHEHKSETMYILHGRIRISLGAAANQLRDVELKPGELIDLPVGTIHSVEALEDSEIIEVSSPELNDVIRIADDFGREGTSAP